MKPRKPNLDSPNNAPSSTRIATEVQAAMSTGRNDPGINPDIDTLRLVALQHNDKLELVDGGKDAVLPPFDPYNNAGHKPASDKPRKSLDDLRKLSAEIAKSKQHVHKSLRGK